MPVQTIYALGESQITISGGGQLDGVTQGDGSHLDGLTITLNTNAWETIQVDDNDAVFQDNDGNQRLDGAQTFDGTSYSDGRRVEAEYRIVVEDSAGNQYTLYAFNINETGQNPSYGTVEGLAFLADSVGPTEFPPIGEHLTVVSTSEGPGGNDTTSNYSNLATPPCFTPGTRILTGLGTVDVAQLTVGEDIWTLDHGLQPIRWIGRRVLSRDELQRFPNFCPIVIEPNAFAPGIPHRRMLVSPQHRILVTGWRAELYVGAPEVLVPAVKLCNGQTIRRAVADEGVTYIHLLFDRHEVLVSDGLMTESYLPSADLHSSMAQELAALFPERFRATRQTHAARPCVSDRAALTLMDPVP